MNRAGAAFEVWNQRGKKLTEVERFIHDDHPMDRLVERGEGLFNLNCSHFPWAVPAPGAVVMEVGSGVGYILQAAFNRLNPSRIIGLDVAEGMIQQAIERLARDKITDSRIEFLHYDGIKIPLPDDSVDFIYSMAVLQHIPKIYVYNLLTELRRVMKPTGYCSLQTFAFSQFLQIPKESRKTFFYTEVLGQLMNKEFAWITFYSFEELIYILSEGLETKDIHIVEKDGSLWFSFAKTGENTFHYDWLPNLRHNEVRKQYESVT